MSTEISQWYAEKSAELGVPQSSLMTIALSEYIRNDQAMKFANNFDNILVKLKEIQMRPIQLPDDEE